MTDAADDAAADTAIDAAADTATDAAADTATDAAADTATDAATDTAADAGPTGCQVDADCDDLVWGPGVCLDGTCLTAGFLPIPAGSFVMGSPPDEVGHEVSEVQHGVTLTHPFELQRLELTRGQWRAILGDAQTPTASTACGDDDCPVTSVSWWEAVAFANALSQMRGLPACYDLIGCTGTIGDDFTCMDVGFLGDGAGGSFYDCEGYRLPSEAEWEYAYRAGTTTALYNGGTLDDAGANSGEAALDPIAWYGDAVEAPQHGGLKDPNLWGLYDMAGNVWEFTSEGWVDFVPGMEAQTDPAWLSADPNDTARVSRGGSVQGQAQYGRAAQRGWIEADTRETVTGFRLARTLPQTLVPCVTQPASCDGLDDNCDGVPDNAAALDPPLTTNQAGVCAGARQTCGHELGWLDDYSAVPHYEEPETTTGDGLDNDCDGLVRVAAGSFEMGCYPSTPSLPNCSNGMHTHPVTLTRSFAIMPREVTRQDWIDLMGTAPTAVDPPCPTCPMGGLSWYDALAYANALSAEEGLPTCYDLSACTGTPGGKGTEAYECTSVGVTGGATVYDCTGYRLPTEAEWEYAYRAGTTTPFYLPGAEDFDNGCDTPDPVLMSAAFYLCQPNPPYLMPGGSFLPNGWGLYDMAGNVAEWTWDRAALIQSSDAVTDPLGPDDGSLGRVSRGGSYNSPIGYILAGIRAFTNPTSKPFGQGFRLVRTEAPQ